MVSEQHELRIVLDVGLALLADVMAAVDLQHEALPDQEIDPMSGDPDLWHEREPHPLQPRHDERLEPGIGERERTLEQIPRGGRQRHPRHPIPIDETLSQGGLPHGQRRLIRLASCNEREDVLDRVDECIRMPRHERLRPVHRRSSGRGAPGVSRGGDVRTVLLEHPEPETPRLGDARHHDPGTCCRDEIRVGAGEGHPALAHPDQAPVREALVDAVPAVPALDQRPSADDAAVRRRERGQGVGRALALSRGIVGGHGLGFGREPGFD